MDLAAFRRSHLIGTCIIWVGMIVAVTLVLSGSTYFSMILPILGGGVVYGGSRKGGLGSQECLFERSRPGFNRLVD